MKRAIMTAKKTIELQEFPMTVSLGCDGSASSDTQNFLNTLQMASLLHKVASRDPKTVPAAAALEMATLGGARALGREKEIGSIETGKKADLIFFDLNEIFSCPSYDPVTALVYSSTPASIKSVMSRISAAIIFIKVYVPAP